MSLISVPWRRVSLYQCPKKEVVFFHDGQVSPQRVPSLCIGGKRPHNVPWRKYPLIRMSPGERWPLIRVSPGESIPSSECPLGRGGPSSECPLGRGGPSSECPLEKVSPHQNVPWGEVAPSSECPLGRGGPSSECPLHTGFTEHPTVNTPQVKGMFLVKYIVFVIVFIVLPHWVSS